VDALLKAVEVEEVAFQAGCQAAELRAVLAATLAAPQRRLAAMHARVRKHLGATAPILAAQVAPAHFATPITNENEHCFSQLCWLDACEKRPFLSGQGFTATQTPRVSKPF
jgi:hypothetical protein